MIINFEFQQNHRLDSEVLTSCKSFMTFDVGFKNFGYTIPTFKCFRENSDPNSMFFTIEKKSLSKLFSHTKFLFVNRFSKILHNKFGTKHC